MAESTVVVYDKDMNRIAGPMTGSEFAEQLAALSREYAERTAIPEQRWPRA